MNMAKAPVTITTKRGIIALNPYASESARTYVATLVDACRRMKIDPRAALVDTDDYPVLMRRTMVEFSIGWLHGCAEASGCLPEQLYDAAIDEKLAEKIVELKAAWGLTGRKTRKAG
jgi:hypothetical protein